MATVYYADGTVIKDYALPSPDERGWLTAMQGLVNGLIQPVRFPDGRVLWVNEEGLLMGLPINIRATLLAREALKTGRMTLVGTCVLTSPDEYLTKDEREDDDDA